MEHLDALILASPVIRSPLRQRKWIIKGIEKQVGKVELVTLAGVTISDDHYSLGPPRSGSAVEKLALLMWVTLEAKRLKRIESDPNIQCL